MNKTIIVKNSYILIKGYERCKKLEDCLTAFDNKFKTAVKYKLFLLDEDRQLMVIPAGFSLEYLGSLLPDYTIKFSEKTDSFAITSFKMTVPPRDERQERAGDFLLGIKDYYQLGNSTQKILALGTSVGKTYCTINYIQQRNVKSLIIVNRKQIGTQWIDEFLKFTNLKEKDFYVLSGKESIKTIMAKSKTNHKVYIAIHNTLGNFINDGGDLSKLFQHLGIGIKVYDEAHLCFESMFNIDSRTNTMETLYLSATPTRTNISEKKVYKNFFNSVPAYGFDEEVEPDEPYINSYYISYNSNPSTDDQVKAKNFYGFNINRFSSYSFDKKGHIVLPIIHNLVDTMYKKNKKHAIIVHTLEQVKILTAYLEEYYDSDDIGLFCGLVKENKLKDEASKRIIISTDKMLGYALTIPDLRGLIMTVPTSSEVVIQQVIGRLRNIGKTCYFFLLTDVGFDSCKKQRTRIKPYIDKKSKKIINTKI